MLGKIISPGSAERGFRAFTKIKEGITTLLETFGILLIVKSCNIEYKKPAKFEDKLVVISEVQSFTKTSFLMKQSILRDNEIITGADVHLVSVDKNGKPSRIPDELKEKLEN